MRKGKIMFSKKNYIEAVKCFQIVTEQDENNYKAQYQLGVAYVNLKENQKAQEAYKNIIRINPKYAPAWKGIGDILFNSNKHGSAEKYYQQAVKLDSKDVDSKIGLANCYYQAREYDTAVTLYEEALNAGEENADVLYNLGNCHLQNKNTKLAIDFYKKSLAVRPKNPDCVYNLGNTYSEAKEYTLAKESYLHALDLNPKLTAAYYTLGNVCALQQDTHNAILYYEKALESEPENVEWGVTLSTYLLETGHSEQVKSLLATLDTLDPNNPDVLLVKERYLEAIGDEQNLAKFYEDVKTNNEFAEARSKLQKKREETLASEKQENDYQHDPHHEKDIHESGKKSKEATSPKEAGSP
jgi:tetratricopeptide (TPR) repeat protein